jgi:two-component SAPR family response regulator
VTTVINGCKLGYKVKELNNNVKELNNNIKVILISTYDSMEDNNKLNFELLIKPVRLQKLLDRVNVYLYYNLSA